MADSMEAGAIATASEMELPLHVEKVRAADASVADLQRADGYLFCAPENLASASGEMLEFFHRTYYHMFAPGDTCSGGGGDGARGEEASLLLGRPYALAIAAGSDGSGAARQLERIALGWRLRPVAPTLINVGNAEQTRSEILRPDKACGADAAARCEELGGLVAATALLAR